MGLFSGLFYKQSSKHAGKRCMLLYMIYDFAHMLPLKLVCSSTIGEQFLPLNSSFRNSTG